MRNKSTLVLIEHMIMLLVFALAAAVCLRLFALAGKMSRTNEATDRAVLVAQNAAEQIKRDGIRRFAEQTGAKAESGTSWSLFYDENWELVPAESGKFVLRITEAEETEYLFRAEMVVCTDAGGELVRLPVAAQTGTEVTANEED